MLSRDKLIDMWMRTTYEPSNMRYCYVNVSFVVSNESNRAWGYFQVLVNQPIPAWLGPKISLTITKLHDLYASIGSRGRLQGLVSSTSHGAWPLQTYGFNIEWKLFRHCTVARAPSVGLFEAYWLLYCQEFRPVLKFGAIVWIMWDKLDFLTFASSAQIKTDTAKISVI